jgi:hypothetical protein
MPPITGICKSMSTTLKGGLLNRLKRLEPIAHHHAVPALSQHAGRKTLIDCIILGQQDAQ